MGVRLQTYVGPFVEVHIPREVKNIDLCKNKLECPNSSDVFCGKCGIKICDRFVSSTITSNNIYEIIDEEFCVFNTVTLQDKIKHYLISNKIDHPGRMVEDESEDRISSSDINKEMEQFKENFVSELKNLKNSSNILFLEVSWGVLSGWH